MQIGTVGKRVGLSVDAIRFYERNNFRILSTTYSNGAQVVFMGRQLRQN